MNIADTAGAKPVAWLIDWPDEPDLGHYFSEDPVDPLYCRSTPLYGIKYIERLHKFLNAAGGEGLVLDGIDAGDLYAELFPERYKAAIAATPAPSVADAAGASEDAQDAARYRWMRRTFINDDESWPDEVAFATTGEALDAAIDALTKESGND